MNTTQSYVIVGGTKGIGLEIIKALNSLGHKTTAISRSGGISHQLKDVEYHCLDVVKEEIPAQLIRKALRGLVYCPGTISLKSFS